MSAFDFPLLKKLCDIPGPSGFEDDVRDFIRKQIEPYVDELYMDPMGNLIAIKGKNAGVLFDAHMDEVGFMITGIREDGTLRFYQIGSVTPGMLPGKRVLIGKKQMQGVIGATPKHLLKDRQKDVSYEDLRIYIGADSKEEAEKLVEIGDFAVFDTSCHFIGAEDNAVASRNMDDRLGCYLLIRMIQNSSLTNAVFSFSVQEETGDRGAAAVAEEIPFRYGIAIDTTSAANLPGTDPEDQVCATHKGGVMSFIDRATTYDNAFIREMYDLLLENGIPVQTKGRNAGGTNASVFQKVGIGHKTLSLSTPALFIHGPLSVVTLEDIDSMERSLICMHAHLTKKDREKGNKDD